MNTKIILMFFLWSLLAKGVEPQVLLEEAVAMVGSGEECTWNNQEIGQKLREIRRNYSQTTQSIDAAAFLAFYLSQIPGDHSKEIVELRDEVKAKSPHSWLAWLANVSTVGSYSNRDGGHQKKLDAALEALANTNGEELSRDPNAMLIFKPLMDRWPPKANDFTDAINCVIVQEALTSGQFKLGEKHVLKIVDPRIKASGEGYMADYLRDHPRGSPDQPRENKRTPGTANDSDSSASSQSPTGSQQVTEPPSANTSRRDSGKFISWFIGLVIIGGSIFFFYQRLKR
jgi:hypothetical protein